MINDSHEILKQFLQITREYGSCEAFFIMGRSLGSVSAIELAHHEDLRGLIIESGLAYSGRQLIAHLISSGHPIWNENWEFHGKVRVRSISIPTLIIHGEKDNLVPIEEARELYNNSIAKDKRLEVIPNADHNSLLKEGKNQYFGAIERFVNAYS